MQETIWTEDLDQSYHLKHGEEILFSTMQDVIQHFPSDSGEPLDDFPWPSIFLQEMPPNTPREVPPDAPRETPPDTPREVPPAMPREVPPTVPREDPPKIPTELPPPKRNQ